MKIVATVVLAVTAMGLQAQAEDVLFSGTVVSTCSILAHSDGVLALSADGGSLTSELLSGGVPGTVTVLSIGSNSLNIDAPTRQSAPGAYVATGESIEVAYVGASGLSLVNQPFTDSATSIPVSTIVASVLTMDNRIVNPNGFPPGGYSTRTVVTCTP